MSVNSSNLVAYWRLNELQDREPSQAGFTLIEEGTVGVDQRTGGKYGSLFLGSADDFLQSVSSGIDRSLPIWIFVIVRPTAVTDQSPVSEYNSTSDGAFYLNFSASNGIGFNVVSSAGAILGKTHQTAYAADTEYVVQAWLADIGGGTHQLFIRVNGVDSTGGSTLTLPYGTGSNTEFRVGQRRPTDRYWNGLIAELAIWNSAPSLSDRAAADAAVAEGDFLFPDIVALLRRNPKMWLGLGVGG